MNRQEYLRLAFRKARTEKDRRRIKRLIGHRYRRTPISPNTKTLLERLTGRPWRWVFSRFRYDAFYQQWFCIRCALPVEPRKWRCPKCGSRPPSIQFMMESDIERLDPWASAVLLSYKRKPVDRRVEEPLIVGGDTESEGEIVVVTRNGKLHEYIVQKPLCWTFAWVGADGNVKTDRWDIERSVTFNELERHIREVTGESDRQIYLISFWALAELRHISDLKEAARDHLNFIHDDTIHVSTESLKIIDAFSYFIPLGLDAVAKFVGAKKDHPDILDGKSWDDFLIKHMRTLKLEHPDIFWTYAEADSVVLLKAFTAFRDYIWQNFKIEVLQTRKVPTLASIAVRILRRDYIEYASMPTAVRYMPRVRGLKNGTFKRQPDREERVLEQRRYLLVRRFSLGSAFGGRRETFGAGFLDKPVVCLDSKGHYNTSAINQPIPNERTRWEHAEGLNMLDHILKWEGYAWLENPREDSPYPLIAKRPEGSRRLGFQRADHEAYATIYEVREAMQRTGLKFSNIEAYGFIPTENERDHPLARLMAKFRAMKIEAEAEAKKLGVQKDTYLPYHFAKQLGNVLIGKFVQAVEYDRTNIEDFYDLGLTDKDTIRYNRTGEKPHRRVKKDFFAPEWSALILGRARSALGVAIMESNQPVTVHTDSVTFVADPEAEKRVIDETAKLGFTFDEKYRADGIYVMRSAVNVAAVKGSDGRWVVKTVKTADGTEIPQVANHAIHTGRKPKQRAQFYQPVLDAVNGGEWDPETKVHKEHMVYPFSEKRHGVPFGSSFLREYVVKPKWDFKRRLPPDFDIKRDGFKRWAWAEPYETPYDAKVDEDMLEAKEHPTKRGRAKIVTEKDAERIRTLYDQGMSKYGIARFFRGKYSPSTVYRQLVK